jgi:hypothetical protein
VDEMEREISIYGDVLFVLQLLWNGYFLFLSGKITKYHFSIGQYIALTVLLSINSVFALQWYRIRLIDGIFVWTAMFLIVKNIRFCVTAFFVMVLAGGLWMIVPGYGGILAVIGVLGAYLYTEYASKNNIYTVKCKKGDRQIQLKALYDTGNCLYLPKNGCAVSIVSYESIAPLIRWEEIEHPEILPYSSVGTKEGLLLAVPLDAVTVLEKNILIKDPYIGIVRQPLSNDGSYEMILHKDIFY